jgi:hypothetical protein
MMVLKNQNWKMECGEDFTVDVQIFKNAQREEQIITSYSFYWTLYDENRAVIIEKSTVAKDITITDGAKGQLEFKLESEETEDLPVGDYYHELWSTDTDTNNAMEFKGELKLQEGHPP